MKTAWPVFAFLLPVSALAQPSVAVITEPVEAVVTVTKVDAKAVPSPSAGRPETCTSLRCPRRRRTSTR